MRPALWACDLHNCLKPHASLDHIFGFLLCCHYFEILNNFGTKGFAFSCCTEPCKLHSWSWLWATNTPFILGSPRVTVPPVCCLCDFCFSMETQMAIGRLLLLSAAPDISFQRSGCLRFVCWPGMERMTPCICHLYSKAESQKIAHQSCPFGFIIPFVTLGESGQ